MSQESAAARILVVEDNYHVARSLDRRLRILGRACTITATAAAARAELAARPAAYEGAIVDLTLADGSGSGFDVACTVLQVAPLVPVLILTSSRSARHVNRAQRLNLDYAIKPATDATLRAFCRRVDASTNAHSKPNLCFAVASMVAGRGLTPQEVQIVALAAEDHSRDEICERLTISINTLKSHIRKILDKLRYESLDDIARAIRRRARSAPRAAPQPRS